MNPRRPTGAGNSWENRRTTGPLTAQSSIKADAPEQDLSAGGRRVLVVDDMVETAKVLARLLERLGDHEIQLAHNGPAAVEAAKAQRPDIILLDIGLPGISGYDVARQLRRQPELDHTLLVALTGYGGEDDRQRSREAGFDQHLVKPPSLDDLRGLLAGPKRLPVAE
jgi:CheY-like chemotaxis protein